MKTFLTLVLAGLAAAGVAEEEKDYVDPNRYAKYGECYRHDPAHLMCAEWQTENAKRLESLTDDVLADAVKDEASAAALLAGVKPDYGTDALVACKIAAVSQYVMVGAGKPRHDFRSESRDGARRLWTEALVKAAATAKDPYVRACFLDQLRWCGYEGQLEAVETVCGALVSASALAESSADIGSVRLKGYLGGRLDAMVERHVSGTDVDYITACFREKTETRGWWQTEFWGKWMHSAVPYAVYADSEQLQAKIERGVDAILESQEASGYIGNYPNELRCGEGWDVWGMKYTMMGLIHFVDSEELRVKGEECVLRGKRALEACKRLCDYVIGEIGPGGKRGRELWQTGNWSGYASSSILEPVVWLYRRTRERRYLDFATYIVEGMTKPDAGPRLLDLALRGVSVADRNGYGNTPETDGGYVMKHNRRKAYEMMSCYRGILDYVEEVEKTDGQRMDDLRLAAIRTAEDIVKEEVNLAGGCACSEAWFHGARKQHLPYVRLQETCVTTTWMRFCEKLLEMTDDPGWADQIERTFYNAYLGAMKADGSEFAAYTPLNGSRWHGMNHCFMHTDCCTANGPRGFLCFLRELFRKNGDTATFNFYASALVDGFDMYSLYPRQNWARIVSHTTGPLKLRLRIPAWSAKTQVMLNGSALEGVRAGSYFTIDHDWKLGDIVEMKFEMPVVAHTLGRHVAFTRGPVLLARDSRFADGDLAEPFRKGIVDGQAMPTFAAVRTPSDDMWMAFSATLPIGPHSENPEASNPETVFFCDYASAGNAWRRDDCYRTWFPVELGPSEEPDGSRAPQ